MNRVIRCLLPLGLLAFLFAFAGPANAQKVANPGTVNFKLTSGVMKVKDQEFGFDESQNINFNGTVDKAGNITIPTVTFPNYPISAGGFNLTVKINVVGPTTGTINPLTGAASLRLRVWIKIDGVPLGGDCRIASSSSPIDVNTLITGTSGSRTGTPYNPSNGTMRIVNTSFAVPASSSCGIASGTVDSTVGLPSPAGNNAAEFNLKTTPNLNRAINPTLNASPLSGTAPFTTTLNATGSTATAGVASYRWDFTNDGTIDRTTTTPTTSFTYTAGGTPTARVQIVDSEGDVADATRQLTVAAFPDLELSAAHDGDFRVGSPARYRVNLRNVGYAATSGAVTVTSTLPAGLTYSSVTGSGWNCAATGQDLTCTRTAAIAVGASSPELGVNLDVGASAHGQVEPTFTVSAAGDNGPDNNSASDPTDVRATDLKAKVSHASHAMLPGPDPANVIELSAENIGDAATVGSTVVTNDLPEGLTPLTAAGDGWDCEITGQLVTCTHAGVIAPGEETDPVSVTVDASLEAGSLGTTVQNEATVTTADDIDPDNDTATDPTLILNGQDVGITKSHEGNFTAGKQATYELVAENFGTAPTTGPTTITDDLPAGLAFVSADGGADWICGEEDGTVTCVHDEPIAAGATAPAVELTVTVGVDAIPMVANTASVTTPDDPNPANDSSEDEAVVQAIDLVIEKSHDGLIRVGRQAEYTLAVRNAGDSPSVEATTVTDVLPAGLSFVSADGGPDWTCGETAGTVTCEYADILEANEQAPDITLIVAVGAAAAPEVTNSVTVATADDFNPANNGDSDTATVIDADTAVGISRTGTFRPGQTGTYLINVRNEGAVPTAHQTAVTVTLPEGLGFVSAAGTGWSCDETDGTVTCTRAAGLGGGAAAPSISLRVDVTPAAVPAVETAVTATTEGDRYPDNDDATDTTQVAGPDVGITSAHDGPFRIGGTHSYTLAVKNDGNGPTTGPVTVTDSLPAGLTATAAFGNGWSCVITGSTVDCERAAALAAGASASPIRLDVTPTAASLAPGETGATVDNEATVSTTFDSNPANDEAVDPTDLVAVDVALAIDGPGTIAIGEIAEYRVQITNTGSAATGGAIRVVDTLPAGFTPRTSGGTDWICSSAGRKVTCNYNQVSSPGDSLPPLTVRARAGSNGSGPVTSTATVTTDGDVVPANDSGSVESDLSAAPDLEIELEARPQSGDKLRVGSDGGYTVSVRNRGSAPTSGATSVRIELPAGVAFLSLDRGQGWSCAPDGSTVTCQFAGAIGAEDIATFGFLVEIRPAAAEAISAEASVSSSSDLNPENDSVVAITEVTRIDLALDRASEPGWTMGSPGSYSLKATNRGTAATTGPVVITENLPVGTTFAGATGDDWTCSVSGRQLRCVNPGPIPPGGESEVRVTLDIGLSASPSINASSTVSTLDDADASNNSATEAIEVGSAPRAFGKPVRILAGRTSTTRSGVVTVWLSCPKAAPSRCRGNLTLKTAGKVRVSKRKKAKLNLGKARFAVAPGRNSPVRITLRKAGRKALKLNRKVRVQAVATNPGLKASRTRIVIRTGK
ncbi:MAG: DUF11 domain-containing protein [Actinomycetota bacterium]|nr:DUF11 domain-containing protein [Actinomycetota bacterium]